MAGPSEVPQLEGCGMVTDPSATLLALTLEVGTVLQVKGPMRLIDVRGIMEGEENKGYELRHVPMGQGDIIEVKEMNRHPTTQEFYLTVLAGPAGTMRTRCSLALKTLKGKDWNFWGQE